MKLGDGKKIIKIQRYAVENLYTETNDPGSRMTDRNRR
jgi:hypothetical protein